MLQEIRVAVDHLIGILSVEVQDEQRSSFCSLLSERLQTRYRNNWFEDDGERGSAARALIWHLHGGGEGLDDDIAFAYRQTFGSQGQTFDEESLYRAFSTPFTLWVDAGCVAIRSGFGPGTYLEGITTLQQQQQAIGVKVLYGAKPSKATLPSSAFAPPVVNLMPSTPALDGPNSSDESASKFQEGARYPSWSNSSSRPVSMSGSSVLTVSSRSSSTNGSSIDGHSEACPSLVAPSSTRGDSESEFEDGEDGSELSIEDMMERGGFKNIDIIDDDDDDDDEAVADETLVQALDRRFEQLQAFNDRDETLQAASELKSATPITSYDGGNVGVLGGGVRLGASKPSTTSAAAAAKAKGLRVNTAWPADAFANGGTTLPLPSPSPSSQYGPYSSSFGAGGKPFASSSPCLIASPSSVLSPYSNGYRPSGHPTPFHHQQHTPQQFSSPQFVVIDGCLVQVQGPKRGRARGRRSRGRGAGRAARRQAAAAALRAQHEAEFGYAPPPVEGQDAFGGSVQDGECGAVPSALGISFGAQAHVFNTPTVQVGELEQHSKSFSAAPFKRGSQTTTPNAARSYGTPTHPFTHSPALHASNRPYVNNVMGPHYHPHPPQQHALPPHMAVHRIQPMPSPPSWQY